MQGKIQPVSDERSARTFSNEHHATQYIQACLIQNPGQNPELARLLAAASVHCFRQLDASQERLPAGATGLIRPRAHWAIRNDDLLGVIDFSAAAATLIAMQGSTPAESRIIAVLVAGLKLVFSIRRKGIPLAPEQTRLLVTLKALPSPATVLELANALGDKPEDVRRWLDSLVRVRRSDGAIVSLVAVDAAARWGTNDV